MTVTMIHHMLLCIGWQIIPARAKIALWERHRRSRKPYKFNIKH